MSLGVYVLMAQDAEKGEQLRGVYSTRRKASSAVSEPGTYVIYSVPLDGAACAVWPASSGHADSTGGER